MEHPTYNLDDLKDRLIEVRHRAGKYTVLQMEIKFHLYTPEVEWNVWDGSNHHKGATPEEALRGAELAHGLIKSTEMPTVILP